MDILMLKEFSLIFRNTYDFLYGGGEPATIIEGGYCGLHDEMMKTDPEYKAAMMDFIKYREDPITSDREAAAAFISYQVIERRQQLKRILQQQTA